MRPRERGRRNVLPPFFCKGDAARSQVLDRASRTLRGVVQGAGLFARMAPTGEVAKEKADDRGKLKKRLE